MSLTPLILAVWTGARRPAAGRAFLLGLTTGIVYFAGTVYWTGSVMAQYGGFGVPLAVGIAALLVAYLALFPATFAWALHVLCRRYGVRALLLAPFAWVATEYGRLALFGGFPWVLLGYSQTPVLPIAQLASVTGVFGLSGLIAAVSTAAAWSVIGRGPGRVIAPLATAALLLGVGLWGHARLARSTLVAAGRPLRVGLVQGNVPQDDKWEPALSTAIFQRYLRLTRQAIAEGARFVVWPESATPFYFGAPGPETSMLRELARASGTAMLIGSDLNEPGRGPVPPRIYNAAFLLKADGEVSGVYRKVHLVPFGEYVPLKSLLFFAAPLVQAVSDFSPGTSANTLPLDGGQVSTAICYEIVYPGLIREGVLRGSELLTTITNDAWFGRSSAPWQHFEMAALRAVEEGRYLVRSANTGISGAVDPYGRVLLASPLFVEGAWTVDVRLLDARTVYSRMGDLAAWVSVVLTVAALVIRPRGAAPRPV